MLLSKSTKPQGGEKGEAAHSASSTRMQEDLSHIVQADPVGMCITISPLWAELETLHRFTGSTRGGRLFICS